MTSFLTSQFPPSNVTAQTFAFPRSLMYYALHPRRIPGRLSYNLCQSCKYLCLQTTITPFHSVEAFKDTIAVTFHSRDAEFTIIHISQMEPSNSKIYISKSFIMAYKDNSEAMSFICPRIWRCDATFVKLDHQELGLREFRLLTGKVEILVLFRTTIRHENGSSAALEELLRYTPNVFHLN